jgi:tetratricopeptide (TPR) repeat protein
MGDYAFCDCSSLTSIIIPHLVPTIGECAFASCSSLKSVIIPNSVTTIGEDAFLDCSSLTSINIPDSVTTIEEEAFLDCRGLSSITVDENNTAYSSNDGVLFNKHQTVLICCPAGKTGTYTIPNTVTTIRWNAFRNCSDLKSITIPNSVTTIGWNAFSHCSGLTKIYVKAINPPSTRYNPFRDVDKSIPVYVCGSVEDYRNAEGWRKFTNIISEEQHKQIEMYFDQGDVYYAKGEYDKAIKAYNKAIKLKPNNTEAYHKLGNVYDAKGEEGKAVKAYNKAIKLKLDVAIEDTKNQIIHSSCLMDYFKRHPNKLKAFIRGVAEGKQMDKHRIMYLLIERYMEFCGFSLGYRTVVYDMGWAVFNQYVKEGKSNFTGKESFCTVMGTINPNYTSEYDEYDIAIISKKSNVEYAMVLYEETGDKEMRAVLCYGLFSLMLQSVSPD